MSLKIIFKYTYLKKKFICPYGSISDSLVESKT